MTAVEITLTEMQENRALKKFYSMPLYSYFLATGTVNTKIQKTSVQLISVYRTTYCCGFFFSVMKLIKPNHRATLKNEHLGELILTALTTHCPDFWGLENQTKT